ncbi:MAG: OsmC family protein [Planctomycetota bacterium]|jgi:organic hydroperoxide reductase OsmC/OhrA
MSEHRVTVAWERGGRDFTYEVYSRDHTWEFDGGATISASAAPGYRGNPDLVDPEQAFVASLSSCHMLTFLSLAAKKRFIVDRYTDTATGHLEKNEEGKLAVARVVLRPDIAFVGEKQPSPEELGELHERALDLCFVANSVKTAVSVEHPAPAAGTI